MVKVKCYYGFKSVYLCQTLVVLTAQNSVHGCLLQAPRRCFWCQLTSARTGNRWCGIFCGVLP